MEFYFPTDPGEMMAFLAALTTAVLGAFGLLFPHVVMKILGSGVQQGQMNGAALTRSVGAMMTGYSASALLLAQPTLYLAFGASLALSAFGTLLSLLADSGIRLGSILALVVQIILATLPLAYVFGLV